MKKKQNIMAVLTAMLVSGCSATLGDLLPQSNTISIFSKTSAPSPQKKVAVVIEDTTYRSLSSAVDRKQYVENEMKYFSKALTDSGITNYQFVSKNAPTEADYLMTITVEDWSVRTTKGGNNEQRASLMVTLCDNKSYKQISQLAGKAEHISGYYDINKFIGNLLTDVLKDMYKPL